MSLLVLHADRFATVVADDPVVPAAGRPALADALALFAEARNLTGGVHDIDGGFSITA